MMTDLKTTEFSINRSLTEPADMGLAVRLRSEETEESIMVFAVSKADAHVFRELADRLDAL